MQGIHTCRIKIQGRIDEKDFNATSPLKIHLIHSNESSSSFDINADQSALIGLIRHLHARGYVLVSINHDCMENHSSEEVLK